MATDKDQEKVKYAEGDHEDSDIDVRSIFKFGIILVVIAVAIHVLLAGLFQLLAKREDAANPPSYPLSAERARRPPLPHLQADPISELKRVREAEERVLKTGSGELSTEGSTQKPSGAEPNPEDWMTGADMVKGAGQEKEKKAENAKGVPIDQAIDEMLQKGLPVRASSDSQNFKDSAQQMPEVSSSARTSERRLR